MDLNLVFLQVETSDGFLLSLQHIPHGKNGVSDNTGPPVFLQHGLFQVFLITTTCPLASELIMLQCNLLHIWMFLFDNGGFFFCFNYLHVVTLNYDISLHFHLLCFIQIFDREETHGS